MPTPSISFERVIFLDGVCTLHRRPGVNRAESPLEVREHGLHIGCVVQHPQCAVQPSPSRDIGNRTAVAGDVVPPNKVRIKYVVVPLDPASFAVLVRSTHAPGRSIHGRYVVAERVKIISCEGANG
jgi:hypothetical protein